jgi:hypothetical protein
MGAFKSTKLIDGDASLIPQAGKDIMDYFTTEGYEVHGNALISTGYDISITKGNIFKAVLGTKTALKILIRPQGGQIYMEAGVGIFGQQAIPSVISMLFFWPLLVTQIWGMVQQSKLDDKAIEIAEESIRKTIVTTSNFSGSSTGKLVYCTSCGASNIGGSRFCRECGKKL